MSSSFGVASASASTTSYNLSTPQGLTLQQIQYLEQVYQTQKYETRGAKIYLTRELLENIADKLITIQYHEIKAYLKFDWLVSLVFGGTRQAGYILRNAAQTMTHVETEVLAFITDKLVAGGMNKHIANGIAQLISAIFF